jgi:hypothetical protein
MGSVEPWKDVLRSLRSFSVQVVRKGRLDASGAKHLSDMFSALLSFQVSHENVPYEVYLVFNESKSLYRRTVYRIPNFCIPACCALAVLAYPCYVAVQWLGPSPQTLSLPSP